MESNTNKDLKVLANLMVEMRLRQIEKSRATVN